MKTEKPKKQRNQKLINLIKKKRIDYTCQTNIFHSPKAKIKISMKQFPQSKT